MKIFSKKNEEAEKSEADETGDNAKEENKEITLEELYYLVCEIAEKVGMFDNLNKEEGDSGKDAEGGNFETDSQDNTPKSPNPDNKDGIPNRAEKVDSETSDSTIEDFLISKGLSSEEIQKVEDFYRGEEAVENSAQPANTGEKELKKAVVEKEDRGEKTEEKTEEKKDKTKPKKTMENSSNYSDTFSVDIIQRNAIIGHREPKDNCLTAMERINRSNAKYSNVKDGE
jgi:hypothetical protein